MLDYIKHSLCGIQDRYGADEARITQKYQAVGQEHAFPLADISLTTANMDMKLI